VIDVQDVAEVVSREVSEGRSAVVGRVIAMKGFSTLPVDELVAISDDGTQYGELLGVHGAQRLAPVASAILAGGGTELAQVPVEIHGGAIEELGLSCGGRADVLLQPTAAIPDQLWSLLSARAPAALVTRISGPGTGPSSILVDRDGRSWGGVRGSSEDAEALIERARQVLASGRNGMETVEDASGEALIECWVPHPRMVVVGTGEMVTALQAQAGLLGWEVADTNSAEEVEGLLGWAGATGALVVLSHDPHVDVPALTVALSSGTPYVGAMGSRSTQARRVTRLTQNGVSEETIGRIHRPIGLNLGGRRAPEVALAIVAEILASHCGRDAKPLRDTDGPIHG
jgi:xanthine dehydrogenase accessory factor